MTTTDARLPLRLTASEAADWFRTHSEDIGREVVIVESPIRPCPPAYLEAWRGLGRWETGLTGGVWPVLTLFARDFLMRPPHFASVGRGIVVVTGARDFAIYSLKDQADPHIRELAGYDRFAAAYIGKGARWLNKYGGIPLHPFQDSGAMWDQKDPVCAVPGCLQGPFSHPPAEVFA